MWCALVPVLAIACGGDGAAPAGDDQTAARGFEPPVLTNPEVPVRYPPELYAQRTEGTVLLRLFLAADGRLVAESTRIVERSGHPDLDSAALAAVALMRFAPARNRGVPVSTAFLQPVHFRHPSSAGGGAF
jgi:protein TonB